MLKAFGMKCSMTGPQPARGAVCAGRSRALARGCLVYHRMVLSSDCVTVERRGRALMAGPGGSIGTHGMLNVSGIGDDLGQEDGETRRLSLTAGGALQERRARDVVGGGLVLVGCG
jgi:hypothetical protein